AHVQIGRDPVLLPLVTVIGAGHHPPGPTHEVAAAVLLLDHPLGLEQCERLPDRRDAGRVLLSELGLRRKLGPRRQLPGANLCAELASDPLELFSCGHISRSPALFSTHSNLTPQEVLTTLDHVSHSFTQLLKRSLGVGLSESTRCLRSIPAF